MADLSELEASGSTKIAGADPVTGFESFWVQSDINGSLFTLLKNASGTAIDFNYGTIGAASIRIAAQIGNATGAAAFGAGTTSAQVLRVVLPTDQSAIPVTQSGSWSNKITDGTTTASVTTNGDLGVVDGLSGGGLNGNLSIPTANTPVEIKVGASRLANRKLITFQATDSDFYWGYSNSVTTSNGTLIKKGATAQWEADPSAASVLQIWIVCSSSSKNGRVSESP